MLRNAVKKYKNDIYNSWARLKRFGITGLSDKCGAVCQLFGVYEF